MNKSKFFLQNQIKFMGFIILCFITVGVYSCKQKSTDTSLKIVAIMPMTGPVAYFGEQEYWGLSVAADEINASGGINGRKVELVVEDTQGDPKNAVTLANKYLSNPDKTIFFVTTSKASKAVIPIADKAGIDTVAFASDPDITTLSNHAIRPYMSFATEQQVITDFIVSKGWKNVAIIRGDDQAFANEMLYFHEFAEKKGLNLVVEELFTFQQRDFRSSYQKILQAKPDVIIALGWGFEVPALLGQYKENRFLSKIPLIGGYTFLTDPAMKGKQELYDGIYVVAFPRAIGSSKIEQLRQRIQTKFGKLPNQFLDFAFAYDYLMMLKEAYKMNPTAKSSIEAILSLKTYDGVATSYAIDSSRDAKAPLTIARYENNLLVNLRP